MGHGGGSSSSGGGGAGAAAQARCSAGKQPWRYCSSTILAAVAAVVPAPVLAEVIVAVLVLDQVVSTLTRALGGAAPGLDRRQQEAQAQGAPSRLILYRPARGKTSDRKP